MESASTADSTQHQHPAVKEINEDDRNTDFGPF